MIGDTISVRARLGTTATNRAGRQAWRWLLRSPLLRWRYHGHPIDHLLIMPQDLRTGDPSFASEIYSGHFGLAGAVALLETESPFTTRPPSKGWERELHGFGWLRHLHAAHDEISREHARTLVRDWIDLHGEPRGLAWDPEIIARRIISWLSHASIFVEGADKEFYDEIMRSFAMQFRFLRSSYNDAPDGVPRLTALIALSLAGLCADEKQPSAFARTKVLSEELKRQILVDGGHLSRNPEALIDLLLDLLPLRQCYIARDQKPPPELLSAIDRMMPMLRFFQIGEMGFAHFNGMGVTQMESLAALMVHDDIQGKPVSNAGKSGYCRLSSRNSLILVDTGHAPPIGLSGEAHAGTLSFEMSSGHHPLIINCGVPMRDEPEWRTVARATAAHSTLVVCDSSSSHLVGGSSPAQPGDTPKLTGPANVQAELKSQNGNMELRASHDGYDQRFGITHVRRLRLAANGELLMGIDQLIAPHGLKGTARENGGEFAIRFHLPPTARTEHSHDGKSALISISDHDGWRLSSKQGAVVIEESVFLADVKGPRRTSQIVIHGTMGGASDFSVEWSLERVTIEQEKQPEADEAQEESHELPLDL